MEANQKPNPKPDQNPNPEPENPAPKPDGEGGKTPLSIRYNKGMLQKGWRQLDSATGTPGGPGVVQDVQQEHAKDENANQAAQEAKQEQIKMNSSRKKLKDTGGTPGSADHNDSSHTDGGAPTDTSESLRDTDGSKSSGGHITTTTTTINGDGTTYYRNN